MKYLLHALVVAVAAATCDSPQPETSQIGQDQPVQICCTETRRLRSKPYWTEERTICRDQDPEPSKRASMGCRPRSSLVPSDVYWDD